jgi:lipoate-protein ligase A
LVISGYKVMGSAQRRHQTGLLQHGSLLLASSPAAPELPGIRELTSCEVKLDSLIEKLSAKLGAVCGVQWRSGGLTTGEENASKLILEEKYSSMQWTSKR